MPPKQQSKNNKQQMSRVTDVTVGSLKEMLNRNDFSGFRNLILGNYNNPQWLKSIGSVNTQPTISFVGGIILQDAIMKIFDSMNKNMFDQKRLEYFQSRVFVDNFMTEIKHVTQVFEVKNDDENSTEFGKWLLDVFNACFKVRTAQGGDKATDECKRVLWDHSSKETYMNDVQKECYICKRPWIGGDGSTKDDKPIYVCSGSSKLPKNFKVNLNFVHCEHVVPFLAALYHVKLARAGDSLDDPILDTQYALAHNGCNELKNNFQMYMKASELKTEVSTQSNFKKSRTGGTTILNVQDGGDGVVTRSQAEAVIKNKVAPERLLELNEKKQKNTKTPQDTKTQKDAKTQQDTGLDDALVSQFQFMYVPNMPMIKALYDAIVAGKYEGQSDNRNSTTLNEKCGQMKDLEMWRANNTYPILGRLKDVLKYINTNIDKLRTDNTPEEQVEMLYDLWGKFKLILAISPKKLDQIFSRGEIVDKKESAKSGGGVQVGGLIIKSDYTIMKEYIDESVKELFKVLAQPAQLNIPLRITGRFKLILGMTSSIHLDPNFTYYEFTMTDRDGSSITTEESKPVEQMVDGTEPDAVPSVMTTNRIHEMVNHTYKYTYDTKTNLKYLQKVVDGKLGEDKFFIMKDPTDPLYAVEYVNFGGIPNTAKNKTFGIYTVFSKDSGNRRLNGGSRGGNIDDINVDKDNDDDDDNDENDGDVRYANFRRVSKTLRVNKHKHDKASSSRSKTFKKKDK